jgi:MFS family permease
MEPESRNHWLVVLAAGLAVFMATVDASIVNLALPAIGANFAASPGRTEWVVLGYLLAMTAFILPAGRWLDGADRRPAMVLAVGGFAVASLAAAASPTLGALTTGPVLGAGRWASSARSARSGQPADPPSAGCWWTHWAGGPFSWRTYPSA